ncbi:MAG: hypothetical protein JSS37_11885 [Proteobacteria bacterium]|nr:hypothetical protein [Pseudomonadota bacterium]
MNMEKKALLILAAIVFLSILAGSIAYTLMNWRIATRIQAELIADRVTLTLSSATAIPRIDFSAATIERFSQISFVPKKLDVIATTSAINKNDRANLIKNLQENGQVTLLGNHHASTISISHLTDADKPIGALESLRIQPGTTLTLDAPRSASPSFTLQLSGNALELTPSILPAGPFKLTAENVSKRNQMPLRMDNQAVNFKIELGEGNPLIKLASEPGDFVVTLTLTGNSSSGESLVKQGSSISKVEFLKQGDAGEYESTLIRGEIRYADFANLVPVIAEPHRFFALDDLSGVTIQTLHFDPQLPGFVLRLTGEAGKIISRTGELSKDHRLTLFDRFWHDQKIVIIFGIIVWVGSIVLGAYKIYQEVKKHA